MVRGNRYETLYTLALTVAATPLEAQREKQEQTRKAAGSDWIEQDFVFASRNGTPLDRGNALHRFQKVCKDVVLPKIRFYDRRHNRASLLFAEGVHAKKIAERLGHASIKLTNGHVRAPVRRCDRVADHG